MLYTIADLEGILAVHLSENSNVNPYHNKTYRQVTGGVLELSSTPEGMVVNRLISSDPSLYLNPKFSPGSRY